MITTGLKQFLKRVRGASSISSKAGRQFSDIYSNHRETVENNDSTPFDFTQENYAEIDKLLAKYPSNYKKSAVIPMLFIAQKQNDNFLTLSAMKKIAQILEISDMEVYEVSAFYTMFNREKVGKYHLQFCGTTPCMLRGIRDVIKSAEDHLGCKLGHTTDDGLFTLVEVECLGACANAPMMQVNNEWVYEDLDENNIIDILETFKRGEEPKRGSQVDRNQCEGPEGRTSLIDYDQGNHVFTRDFSAAKQEWEDAKAN